MFEAAELGRQVSREEYKQRVPKLRTRLLELQQQLRGAPFPVIVVFAGVDGAGKGETINLLNAWMDPRWIVTRAFGAPSDEERERPEYWRFWRDLPQCGRIGLFLSSWYSQPVLDRAYRRIRPARFEQELGGSFSSNGRWLTMGRSFASSGCTSTRRPSAGGSRRSSRTP